MFKKILIAGSSGLIGKKLLSSLLEKDFEIYALTSSVEKLSEFKDTKINILTNEDFFKEELNLNDAVFLNLAFPRKNDIKLINSVIDFMYEIYDEVRLKGCKHIINMSSQSVYDINRTKPAIENGYTRPFNLYGFAKLYVETFTRQYCQENDMFDIHLRLGSVVGPYEDVRINNKFIKSILNDEDITVYIDNQIYSYIDINDVVDGLIAIIEESDKLEWNTIYNFGTKYKYTTKEIFDIVKKEVKHEYKGNINFEERDLSVTNEINVDKLYNLIDFRPRYDAVKSTQNILKIEYRK